MLISDRYVWSSTAQHWWLEMPDVFKLPNLSTKRGVPVRRVPGKFIRRHLLTVQGIAPSNQHPRIGVPSNFGGWAFGRSLDSPASESSLGPVGIVVGVERARSALAGDQAIGVD